MLLLFLEALGAGLLFIVIIWWTMFSGRKNGELPKAQSNDGLPKANPPSAGKAPSASTDAEHLKP